MDINNEDFGKAKGFMEQILRDFDYTKVGKADEVGKKDFFTGALGTKATKMTFILASPDAVREVITHLESYGIYAESPQKKFPHEFKVGIPSVCEAYEKAFPQEVAPITPISQEDRPLMVGVKTNNDIIERLFADNKVTYKTANLDKADATLFVQFVDEKMLMQAERILTGQSVDYVSADLEIIISLALPDKLLNGKLAIENIEEKGERRLSEYESRLRFVLKQKLGLNIHMPANKKKVQGDHIIYAGNHETCRIDFAGTALKDRAQNILKSVGFHCSQPRNGEKLTLLVDLGKSEQKVLLQELEDLTFEQIKAIAVNHGELAMTSEGNHKIGKIKYRSIFFIDQRQAEIFHKLVVNKIDGVITKSRGVHIPVVAIKKRIQDKSPKKITSTITSIPSAKTLVRPEVAAPLSHSNALLEQYKVAVRKEIEDDILQSKNTEIIALEKALDLAKKDNDRLLAENTSIRNENYFIAKNCKAITIPLIEIGKGVIMAPEGMVISIDLLVQ